jgi:hypothetical protein
MDTTLLYVSYDLIHQESKKIRDPTLDAIYYIIKMHVKISVTWRLHIN